MTKEAGEHTKLKMSTTDGTDATHPIFDEDHLQSRLELIRQYVARPIPTQPWDDTTPALIPFHDDGQDDASFGDNSGNNSTLGGGGIIIGGARHAANIPLLQSMNVTAVLNCASGVSYILCYYMFIHQS